jgi:hypothetical protein
LSAYDVGKMGDGKRTPGIAIRSIGQEIKQIDFMHGNLIL